MKLTRTLALLFAMLTSLTIVLFAGFTETMAQTVAAQQSLSAQAQAKRSVNPLAVFPKDRILQRSIAAPP